MPIKKTVIRDCDIFCNVIDNYGDIGVCWRLARQLASEHGCSVNRGKSGKTTIPASITPP